jgi:hypothetical protein
VSTKSPDSASLAAARDARRWLIGVSISLVFGLFGVVMALLGYLEGTRPAAPAGMNMPAKPAREPAARRHDRERGDRHK